MNKTNYNGKKKASVNPEVHEFVNPEVRKFEGELRPLMTEEENGRNHGKTETRKRASQESRIYGIRD